MKPVFSYWDFNWTTVAGLCCIVLIYFLLTGFGVKRRFGYFIAGIILLCICLMSPLYFLGEHYLFSAHMLSHVLIILVAAPLLVVAIPSQNTISRHMRSFSGRVHPMLCWISGVAVMWVWHIPAVFNYMFSMDGMALMQVHQWSLLTAGIFFCWPVVGPYPEHRLPPLRAVLYLSTACVFCSVLGLMITFADPGTFSPYANMPSDTVLASLIRHGWQISATADQQMAGLIMWVPCCVIYLTASMILLIRWLHTGENLPSPLHPGTPGIDIYPN